MLVALEALKTSVGYLGYDIVTVNGKIDHCVWRNNQDNSDIYDDEQANWSTFRDMDGKYGKCRDKCQWAQSQLDENRDALVLYCQQFAFASEMNHACSTILTCRGTQKPYRYNFNGSGGSHGSGYNNGGHDVIDPDFGQGGHHNHNNNGGYDDVNNGNSAKSTHGIELHYTGGHVQPAYDVDPEIAAAAVTAHEAVI